MNTKSIDMHTAAMYGHLDQIPRELITAESVSQKDNYGLTVLHTAARDGHLDQIPASIIP